VYELRVRSGPKVTKERHDTLEEALEAIEQRGRELERSAPRLVAGGTLIRRFEPVQQVTARLELFGPARLRAGLDVRGDGSSEAYTGRLRRRLVEQSPGESAYSALRRAVKARR
jgi:hypothetical protein